MLKKSVIQYALISIIAALLFVPFLGEVHLFDWDELNFAEAAREMLVTGDWLTVKIDYQPFHEKPPFFIWMQAISMSIFGVSEFSARLPNALMGIITLLILFRIGKNLFDDKFGMLWALVYLGSFLPHFYFKSAIIDPYFNFFMFTSMYYLSKAAYISIHAPTLSNYRYIIIAGVLNSFAVLTKGPVGFLLVFLTWMLFWIVNRKDYIFPLVDMILFSAISFTPIVIWYLVVFTGTDGAIIGEFISYQIRLLTTGDAGHSQPIYYHFLVIFFGCFPATAFIFGSLQKRAEDGTAQSTFKLWNFILLAVVLVVFSIVKTKIIHYSSLAYFPVTFLAAYSLHKYIYRKDRMTTVPKVIVAVIGLLYAAAFIGFPLLMKNIDLYLDKVTDEFTKALLLTDVSWGYEYIIGIIYACIVLLSLIFFRKDILRAAFVLFGGTAVTILIFLTLLAPKIEPYTQGAPIEFFKSLQGEDAYIHVLGYKSYAHYFYARMRPEQSAHVIGISPEDWERWLLEGFIDKPVYFVSHNKRAERYLENYHIEELYRKSGFVFMRRLPKK